jgi:hypothetical protein
VADITAPVAMHLEHHLYYPGDTVQVKGSVWMELLNQVDSLNIVKVEIKDSAGNVIAREDATVNKNDGSYSTSLRLLDNAGKGAYNAEARVELEADALGIVKTITSAGLQSSMQFAVAAPVEYDVEVESEEFKVTVASNSGINDFQFKQHEKRVSFFVEGSSGTGGVTEISIPKRLLSGEMSVFMDQSLVANDNVILKSETETKTTFEINYSHSIHRMEVVGTNAVPEFPLAAIGAISAAVGVLILIGRLRMFSLLTK